MGMNKNDKSEQLMKDGKSKINRVEKRCHETIMYKEMD